MNEQIKKEAEELVNKFLPEIQGADRYNYNLDSMNLFIAKQCAVICISEIEKALMDYGDKNHELQNMDRTLNHYTQLKQYITDKM